MQKGDSFQSVVGQSMVFEDCPDVLIGIQFRGVGGKPLDIEPAAMSSHESLSLLGAVGFSTVPQHDDGPAQMPQEETEELDDFGGFDVPVGVKADVEPDAFPARRNTERGDRGDLLAVSPDVPENRGLSARTPGAPDQRQKGESCLIEKNEMGVTFSGFFLYAPSPSPPTSGWPSRPARRLSSEVSGGSSSESGADG